MNLVTPAVPCLRQVVHALADPYRTTGRVTVSAALAYLTGRQEQAAEQLQHRLQSCALLEYERISRAIFPTGLLVPTYREHTCAHGRARAPLPPAAPADTSASPPVALNGNRNSTLLLVLCDSRCSRWMLMPVKRACCPPVASDGNKAVSTAARSGLAAVD